MENAEVAVFDLIDRNLHNLSESGYYETETDINAANYALGYLYASNLAMQDLIKLYRHFNDLNYKGE